MSRSGVDTFPAPSLLGVEEEISTPQSALGRRRNGPAKWARLLVPLVTLGLTLAAWEIIVRACHVHPYILPGPITIIESLVADWGLLSHAWEVTLEVTGLALLAAVALGVCLALVMSLSPWFELMFFPYMIIMQVTPIIAIAPLLILWVDNLTVGLVMCAWLVAFFPIVSNTMTGLKSADRHLEDLFKLYGASRWQTLWQLRLPAAMPYFLAGLRISGGLSLIGAIAAEFVAGTGGQGSGLAFQVLQAGYQMDMPRLFAALFLISATGLTINLVLTYVSYLALRRWHETALERER
jgi:NitT/TauT family transport system permease protein